MRSPNPSLATALATALAAALATALATDLATDLGAELRQLGSFRQAAAAEPLAPWREATPISLAHTLAIAEEDDVGRMLQSLMCLSSASLGACCQPRSRRPQRRRVIKA